MSLNLLQVKVKKGDFLYFADNFLPLVFCFNNYELKAIYVFTLWFQNWKGNKARNSEDRWELEGTIAKSEELGAKIGQRPFAKLQIEEGQ